MTLANSLNTSVPEENRVVARDGKSYSYWRLRILYASIIGYATFYLVRQNFSMAMPGISAEFGYSKTDLGWILTAFSFVYGMGKFINGYISDRSNARIFISIGLFASASISILVGYTSWFGLFALLWALNGWFQSMGWAPCARMLTHWFSPRELGTKWSIWSSSHQIGSAGIFLLAGYLIEHHGWRWAFLVPGMIGIVLTLFLFNRLRDNPTDLGFPPVEEYKGDVKHELDTQERLTFKETIHLVFKNRLVWYISIANLFLYIPRMGVLNWAPVFLKDFKQVDLMIAGGQLAGFDVAGLIGGVAAGWISDRYFKSRRGPVATLYLIFLSLSVFMLWKIPPGHVFLDAVALFFAGFLVAGPQVLVGIALADFASKRAVGVATGFAGVMSYVVGSIIHGAGIGKIVDVWGWDGGFMVFLASSLLGAVFFALTWNARPSTFSEDK